MAVVGVRALKQNASAVVARAGAGETVTVTDRGRPVARIVPLSASPLAGLIEAGAARPAPRALWDLPEPTDGPSSISDALDDLRAERL